MDNTIMKIYAKNNQLEDKIKQAMSKNVPKRYLSNLKNSLNQIKSTEYDLPKRNSHESNQEEERNIKSKSTLKQPVLHRQTSQSELSSIQILQPHSQQDQRQRQLFDEVDAPRDEEIARLKQQLMDKDIERQEMIDEFQIKQSRLVNQLKELEIEKNQQIYQLENEKNQYLSELNRVKSVNDQLQTINSQLNQDFNEFKSKSIEKFIELKLQIKMLQQKKESSNHDKIDDYRQNESLENGQLPRRGDKFTTYNNSEDYLNKNYKSSENKDYPREEYIGATANDKVYDIAPGFSTKRYPRVFDDNKKDNKNDIHHRRCTEDENRHNSDEKQDNIDGKRHNTDEKYHNDIDEKYYEIDEKHHDIDEKYYEIDEKHHDIDEKHHSDYNNNEFVYSLNRNNMHGDYVSGSTQANNYMNGGDNSDTDYLITDKEYRGAKVTIGPYVMHKDKQYIDDVVDNNYGDEDVNEDVKEYGNNNINQSEDKYTFVVDENTTDLLHTTLIDSTTTQLINSLV